MGKLIKFIVFLIMLVIAVIIVVPFAVPVETFKQTILQQVKQRTGRDLVIAGDMKASVYPVLGIELGKVSLSNPDGFTSKTLLQVDKLTLDVDLMALLQRKLQVKRFILDHPVINLETNASGVPDWQISTGAPAPAAASPAPAAQGGGASSALLGGLMIGEVKVSDGEIHYIDGKAKQAMSLTALNLSTSLPSLSQPLTAKGSTVWHDEKLSFDITVSNPSGLMQGVSSDASVTLEADPVKLAYNGSVSKESAKGSLALSAPSLPKLAQWAGSAFAWNGSAPLSFDAKGDLLYTPRAITLTNSDIRLDDIVAKGNLRMLLGEKVPGIEANISAGTINVNPYLPKPQASNEGWFISPAMAAVTWSNDHIDLSGLRSVNAKVNLTTSGINYDKVTIGKTTANLQLANGLLLLTVPEAALYGGKLTTNLSLDAAGSLSDKLSLTGVQAEPLLKDMAAYDRLSGTLNLSADLKGTLLSQREFIQSLNGNGLVSFRDGALKGVDLAGMVRNLQSAFRDVDTTRQKTDFSELSGSFTILRGIITNNDLSFKAPLLRLTGSGQVNLPLDVVDYRLVPMVVATAQGQDGKEKQGIEVPINVTGSMDNLKYTPDVAATVQKAIENPEAIKGTVKDIKQQLKEGKTGIKELKGLFKGLK